MSNPEVDKPTEPRALDLGRVGDLRIKVTFGRVLEGPAHDVFLLDVHPPSTPGERFDETPYLDVLEPILHTHGTTDPYVVHVNRTHSSWDESAGKADIVVALATGHTSRVEPTAAASVASAFRKILGHADEPAPGLGHDDAITRARLSVESAYPDVHADRLMTTDEQHMASSGTWSVGLSLPDLARFQVTLGFVDGDAGTTHIRRTPASEVVDSIGTGSDG